MAKRLNPRHQEMVRAKIQTTKLLQLLQQDAEGKIVLRDGQRDSAKFLVNKSLANPPEQKDINVSGGMDMSHSIEFVSGKAPATGQT